MKKTTFLLFGCLLSLFSVAQNRIIVNPSFENGSGIPHTNVAYLESQVGDNPTIDGWFSTHPSFNGSEGAIEHWASGFQSTPSDDGGYHVELNVSQPSRLYQIVYLVNGESIDFAYSHRKRQAGTQTVEFSVFSQDGSSEIQSLSTNTASSQTAWDNVTGNTTFTGPTGVYQIGFEATAPATGGSGNFLDNITIGLDGLTEFPTSTLTATEGDASFDPTILINGNVPTASSVTFTVDASSTAVEGVDFNFPNKTLSIPGTGDYGLADALPIGLTLLDDTLAQGSRTLVLNIDSVSGDVQNLDANGDGYIGQLTITIEDNDPPPGGIAGANLWYKADAGVTTGTFTWANQGTFSTLADATTRAGANSPTYNNTSSSAQINFNPSISFNSSNTEALATPTITGPILGSDGGFDVGTQFVVFRQVSSADNIYNYSDGTSAWAVGGTSGGALVQQNQTVNPVAPVSPGQVALADLAASTASSGSTFDLQLNGGPSSTTSGASYVDQASGNALNFAFYNGGYATVDIAEIVLYPSLLSAADRNKVQSYLAIKYGISLGDNTDAVAYTSSNGTEVWTADATYKFDIFGIGKDDTSSLDQSQSNSINTGSGDGTGQSGAGNIVLSNPTSLDDGDYLLVGHDNAALTELAAGTDLPASLSGFTRIDRQWLVKETGDVGNVDLTFDTFDLGYAGTVASSYRLLIDTDQDGDFTTGQPTIVQADPASLSGNTTLIFNDLDLQDSDQFTIITAVPSPGVGNDILWLEANNGLTKNASNEVTGWADQAGFNAFTVVGTPTYEENAINFNPVVNFANTDAKNALPSNRLDGNQPIDVVEGFAVYKYNSTSNRGASVGSTVSNSNYGPSIFAADNDQRVYFGNGLNSTYQSYANTDLDNTFTINNLDVTSSSSPFATGRLNGAIQTISAGGGGDFTSITVTPMIGGTNNTGGNNAGSGWFPFNGALAEVVLYPSSLNVFEKLEVESYLAIKYGITLDPSVGNYLVLTGPTTTLPVWNNTSYWNDVFGIARDDVEGLNPTPK